MRFCRWFMLVLSLVTFASPRGYPATPDSEKQARRSFERAEAHFKAGLYDEALAEYQEGYAELPLPGFLINIAQCQRRLGQLAEARTTYRKFLIIAPDSPYVPGVTALLAEIDELLAPEDGAASPPEAQASPAASSVPDDKPSSTNELVTLPAQGASTAAPTKTRWWLWGGVGGAVVVGVLTAVLLSRSSDAPTIHDGSIGTLRR